MSLLLVVVLLFFSSSCSVSSGQYYVSDNCSSVTNTPCNPLSVYAGNMSQYNNSIFYFIGASDINDDVNMTAVRNVTLHGLDQACLISSRSNERSVLIHNSSHVIISNMFINNFHVIAQSSNNITITNSSFNGREEPVDTIFMKLNNAFDIKISSSVFFHYAINITYKPLPICSIELLHYSLILTNVTLKYSGVVLSAYHGASYNLSAIFHNYNNILYSHSLFILGDSLFSFCIKNASFQSALVNPYAFHINFAEKLKSVECKFPGIQSISTFVIEDSQFHDNQGGLLIFKNEYLPGTLSNHFIIIIKSCSISNNMISSGLKIDTKFLTPVQIKITDTKLIGNQENVILNSNAISLSNVTVANTRSTGLLLRISLVTIENKLTFKNNTGVFGGGLSINDLSKLVLTSSANLEFIDNHASYKGGGIYVKELGSDIILEASNVPLTLKNNSAAFGDDIYGYTDRRSNRFNLTNPSISSTGDARKVHFCNKNLGYKQIYPGQVLKFHIALFGYDYFGSLNFTDGILEIRDGIFPNSAQTVDLVYARPNPDSNCSSLIEYKPNHPPSHAEYVIVFTTNHSSLNYQHYIVNACPIGFSINSSQGRFICACSQSISRENVTCDITSLNITHNGLLWIGMYNISTSFNATANNIDACIINEDCLLYCFPNPVTFKLNDTDTQCVDNRGQRMCGSCREGYSLLMGSNKCGQCHNNYMMIAWIALFAVMGVLLVVLLIALNLTVSVGTLNGLLFYANIVKLYEPVFSRKGALPVLSQVISWINLDFGFEICLYNGMDSYVKQWLQFAFPLYLWIIIIIIIQLCRRYGKISRLMGSHAVPVLSTLFLLSYTKLVRTIVIVLHKREVTLHCTNEPVRSVSLWYEDPNVEYAKGKHAVLFAFALMVAVFFIIPYTLFLLLNSFYERHFSNFKVLKKVWNRFKPIIDAYSGPMKDEYRFWPGLLLVARIPVLLSATLVDSFIQSQHFLLSMLLTVLAIVLSLGYCFGGVYMKRMNNIIEVWFLLNLCIMASLSVAFTDDSKLSHMECYDALIKKLFKKQNEDDDPLLDVTDSHLTVDQQRREIIPSSTDYIRRESVVDLF
uniref:Right handed beta helix domain-containing protein n=1 Tax=Amphimedon queenslandica TaxID=400682 RepID=A0A1X7UAN1_AMPQE